MTRTSILRPPVFLYETYLHITSSCIPYDTYLHITSSCIPLRNLPPYYVFLYPLRHLPPYYVFLYPLRHLPPYYVILYSLTTPTSTLRHPVSLTTPTSILRRPVFPYDNQLHVTSPRIPLRQIPPSGVEVKNTWNHIYTPSTYACGAVVIRHFLHFNPITLHTWRHAINQPFHQLVWKYTRRMKFFWSGGSFKPLKTQRRLLYLNTQFVPRSKHF